MQENQRCSLASIFIIYSKPFYGCQFSTWRYWFLSMCSWTNNKASYNKAKGAAITANVFHKIYCPVWNYFLTMEHKLRTNGFGLAVGTPRMSTLLKGILLNWNSISRNMLLRPHDAKKVTTTNGKIHAINTGDSKITGWNMWGGNAVRTNDKSM